MTPDTTRASKHLATACAGLLLSIAGIAHADVVHKCATGAGVAYQSAACSEGQTELARLVAASTELRPPVEAAATPRATRRTQATPAASPRWRPFRRSAIETGMTDDEVLNTPDGGVPTKIRRSRERHAWREVWIYTSGAGPVRELEFTNGRLTSIATADANAESIRVATLAD